MNDISSVYDKMSQADLARYLISAFRRAMLHYGIWFNEVEHQLGLEETLKIESDVAARLFPIVMKRLAKTLDFPMKDDIPAFLLEMPREKLNALIDAMCANWLAGDGVWFQAVENREGMDAAKRCNDTCWSRYSPLEASAIKDLIKLPDSGGLDALEQALALRLYARINKQSIERQGNSVIFKMLECRVQSARKRQNLPDYPYKSAGIVEFPTFARTIDPRIKVDCIGCPPDPHPAEWACAWRFYIE